MTTTITTVCARPDQLKKARELKLNCSAVFRKALDDAIYEAEHAGGVIKEEEEDGVRNEVKD